MTDRVLTLVVSLEQDFRTDDVEHIINAIKMVKYVRDVEKNIYTGADHMNVRAGISSYKLELIRKLMKELE